MHSGIHACLLASKHPCIYAFMVLWIHASTHPCIHASIPPRIHASMHPCIYAFMYFRHPCIYASMHACMHPMRLVFWLYNFCVATHICGFCLFRGIHEMSRYSWTRVVFRLSITDDMYLAYNLCGSSGFAMQDMFSHNWRLATSEDVCMTYGASFLATEDTSSVDTEDNAVTEDVYSLGTQDICSRR